MRVAQADKPRGLSLWRDVAPHGGGIGADLARRSAEQSRDRLARLLAAQIPYGGIKPRHGAAQIGAGVFMFAQRDLGDHIFQRVDTTAQCPRGHLAMQDLGRDVAVIGRDLPPALRAIRGRDPHETDQRRGKGLDPRDARACIVLTPRRGQRDSPRGGIGNAHALSKIRSAARLATIIVGALVLAEVTLGKTEASMTRKPATPCTRQDGSTTELPASCPILQVPTG